MRLVSLLFAAVAVPALAAAEPVQVPPSPPTAQEVAEAQKALTDPTTSAAVARMTGALSKALMDLPVGEMEAAIEGRPPTAADRQRTVRDSIGNPEEAARVEREIATSGAQMQTMQRALAAALPGIISAAGELEKAIGQVGVQLPPENDQSR